MSSHSLGGLLIAGMALVLGIGGVLGALRRQSRRAQFAETYASMGGPAYTVAQIGCAAVLIVIGLVIGALILVGGRR